MPTPKAIQVTCSFCKQDFPVTIQELRKRPLPIAKSLGDPDDHDPDDHAPDDHAPDPDTVRRRVPCKNCEKENIVSFPKEWLNE